MPCSQQLYVLIGDWLHALGIVPHKTARAALAHQVTALLVGQSLRRTALMRTLLSPSPVPARQRYKRVARALDRRWLTSEAVTPALVRAALALVPPDPAGSPTAGLTHLALDSVRCGRWELFTLGVVWHGRILPVGWRVIPYPWPTGLATPTICALIRAVGAAWPAERPAQVVADRAFPSYQLFGALQAVGWGWTLRLQARHWVTVAEQTQQVRDLLPAARVGSWRSYPGAYGCGDRAVPGTLVVGRGLVVLPCHQRTAGSLRHRAKQQARRQQHLASKHPNQDPAALVETDAWVVLFTSPGRSTDPVAEPRAPRVPVERMAQASYRRRWGTEGTYRDAQGGWDGQHGWDLEVTVARLTDAAVVDRLAGLWALGTLLQTWLGHQIAQADTPAAVRAVVRQWTTTGRLSVWARGRLALTEPSGWLTDWLLATLAAGAQRVAAAPPPPERVLPFAPFPRRTRRRPRTVRHAA